MGERDIPSVSVATRALPCAKVALCGNLTVHSAVRVADCRTKPWRGGQLGPGAFALWRKRRLALVATCLADQCGIINDINVSTLYENILINQSREQGKDGAVAVTRRSVKAETSKPAP